MVKKIIFLLVSAFPVFAHSSVVIMGTRVVYPAQKKSINVQITNNESSPSLIQSWIDDGNAFRPPDSVLTPFIITPPIFRIEPKSGQTLRIMYTHETLPLDRETLFYLNVLDIPAKPKPNEYSASGNKGNFIQLAVRSRIKLFFRPAELKINPADSYNQVLWRLKQNGNNNTLQVDNKTPYYITYSKVQIQNNQNFQNISSVGMLAPFTTKYFPLKERLTPGAKISWVIINDYGGYQEGYSVLK
ncbi:TPA: molecular chaperone [Salmonella enterica]|nr:molecular chaperone [Salmonella enterica]